MCLFGDKRRKIEEKSGEKMRILLLCLCLVGEKIKRENKGLRSHAIDGNQLHSNWLKVEIKS